ncbi:MAG: PilZ domain-containing protein [Gammaproteobacteria bacterium]|nr:PilZ domain-containing protein [Gammaproteobacteria bacterium]MDH5728844.1 PilZ domain-containing protein [Gammaproteobacteria bacterium]
MQNNRRLSNRRKIITDVVLRCPLLGLVRGLTRDLSEQGAFIETGNVTLHQQDSVEIFFPEELENKRVMRQVQAQVVRVTGDGIGLAFHSPLTDYKN